MHTKSLKQLSALLQSKQVSATELAQHFLARIDTSNLNAFLHVDLELTLQQAALADRRLAGEDHSALTGIPIAHKDIFVTRDWRATAGSKMLANYTSPFDATVVERLGKAGMVTLGKLNCDEFAMGSSNQNSFFGPVSNPWDKSAIPGGSSGGSAAAIAARLAPAEASSNLSRFDGVRYGHRAEKYSDLTEMYKRTRAEGFGEEVKLRILVGAYVLSHGYFDAYYLKAQKIRRLIAQDFQQAFTQCDVIMGPVSPTVAWNLGDKADDPVANYLADIYTLSTSLAGLPGMSVPCGFGQGDINSKRPVGLQLIGNYFEEAKLLNIAHQYQQATGWHLMQPAD